MKLQYILATGLVFLVLSCGTTKIVRKYGDQIQTDIIPLSDFYKNSFLIGAAVEPDQLQMGEGALLSYHFNSLTAENAMKFKSIHPEPDVYHFEQADRIVTFAKRNHLKMRGHTFIWHHPEEIASWIFFDESGNSRSRLKVLGILRDHMTVLLDRYGDDVYCWDVVNEVIDISQTDNMRRTAWYKSIGSDYVEQAFIMAHEINPDVKLFLNEYDTFEPQKREAFYQFVKTLIEKDIPIDGVGFQLHINLSYPEVSEIEKTINRFRDLGIEIHITELDMSLYSREFQIMEEPTETAFIRQAHRYREIFEILEKNEDIIGNVTFWGFNDGHTWLSGESYNHLDWPLPFGREYLSKPAYLGIIQSDNLPEDVHLEFPRQNLTYYASLGRPIIDGDIDVVWEKAPWLQTDTHVMDVEGAVAKIKILWDEDSLYILADVSDRTVSNFAGQDYMNDSIEFFLDEFNDRSVALGKDDFHYRIGMKNEQSFNGQGRSDKVESVTVITDGGYLVEFKVELQYVSGEPGLIMGADFQVNDNFGNGQRDAISKWNDPTNESWRDTTGWGTLELIP